MEKWLDFLLRISLAKANWSFKIIPEVPRPILIYWIGYLSATQEARHMLSLTKLTGWKDSETQKKKIILPEQADPRATHDFSAVYQKVDECDTTRILFRFQIESNDKIATQIAHTLAEAMNNCRLQDKKYLLDSRYADLWQEIASIELRNLQQSAQVWKL
jgi:hypothetical protein